MKKFAQFSLALSVAACLLAPAVSNAAGVYAGIGFPGLTVGYDYTLSSNVSLRGEFSGGLNVSRNGQRSGIDLNGNLKANSLGAFADWYPMSGSGFRATGGVTLNDTKVRFSATSQNASATINGKPVNLTGETFIVDMKYPGATPYLGLGYSSKRNNEKGWGFFADAGVTIGKFNTSVSTTIVGKQGITQADVDAQTSSVRDSINKLSVLPKLTIGAVYSF